MDYELQSDGSLNLEHKGKTLITLLPEDEIGILYDNDGGRPDSDPIVLKHGDAEDVLRHYQRYWSTLMAPSQEQTANAASYINATQSSPATGAKAIMREIAGDIEMIRIRVGELNTEMVEEINACLETNGRIGKLQERLLAMAENTSSQGPKLT